MRDEYIFEMLSGGTMYRVTRTSGNGAPYVSIMDTAYVGKREAELIAEGYSVWSSTHAERVYVRDVA